MAAQAVTAKSKSLNGHKLNLTMFAKTVTGLCDAARNSPNQSTLDELKKVLDKLTTTYNNVLQHCAELTALDTDDNANKWQDVANVAEVQYATIRNSVLGSIQAITAANAAPRANKLGIKLDLHPETSKVWN